MSTITPRTIFETTSMRQEFVFEKRKSCRFQRNSLADVYFESWTKIHTRPLSWIEFSSCVLFSHNLLQFQVLTRSVSRKCAIYLLAKYIKFSRSTKIRANTLISYHLITKHKIAVDFSDYSFLIFVCLFFLYICLI